MSSTFALSILSAAIICVNIWQLADSASNTTGITAITIMMSICVLVISLLVNQANYGEREIKFHQCAQALNTLYDKASILLTERDLDDKDKMQAIIEEYNQIIEGCDLNHSVIDYKLARAYYSNENAIERWCKINWNLLQSASTIYWLIGVCVPALLISYFACVSAN